MKIKGRRINSVAAPPDPRVRVACGLAAVVLIAGGGGHRWLNHELNSSDPVRLERPLSSVPLEIGPWKGSEIEMNERVITVAGCDDYICRRYVDEMTQREVGVYVAYAARPARMLGHRPEVCYPSHGWTPGEVRKESVRLDDGTALDYLMRTVSRADQPRERLVVLNYYILEGRCVTDWQDFWGPRYRLPNLSRDPNFYVAQVQITATVPMGLSPAGVEKQAAQFAGVLAGELNGFFLQGKQ